MLRLCATAFLTAFVLSVASGSVAADRGSVTNLPIPRFVSLKASEGNARRGPSLSHRIDWVFRRRHMPLRIIDEYGHWRRVQDRDGATGWMHYSLLSGVRTVIVEKDGIPLRIKPDQESSTRALLEMDVIAWLEECVVDWCRITAESYRGWVPRETLWGVAEEDVGD
ncbi:MAG: SH3 domain-containing protein [Rhodobacter sp.]|nr:SH3 domain-containing protein [Rhodobacter sp.]MCY4168292.1 SH3 domain-containing protein [Rhodobacter sp.]MCY4241829.1 SH3 domain-containing protein [Rhodobacter sp.]